MRAGRGVPGWTTKPSVLLGGRRCPHRRSSATTAAMRSVSWPRMSPTPRTRVGPSANTATAARVWAMSGMSDMSTSPSAAQRPGLPVTVVASAVRSTGRPWRRAGRRTGRRPGGVAAPSPATVTRPPSRAAAASRYEAAEASGSTR